MVLLGFALGAQPIGDNSTFVHLRTGIDIVEGLGIPRRDPYSFTARGTPWVVQSWLPEVIYGLARRLGGDGALLVLQGILTATLAYLVFRLLEPAGSTLRVAGSAVAAIAVGGPFWSPRPLLFGLVCLGLTMLVVLERRAPWLLVPIVWVWVSSHGSFPLGALWLVLVAIGSAIDHRRLRTEEATRLMWFCAGILIAGLNPLGPRLLLFPLVLGDHSATFREIAEWQSPDFQHPLGRISLVGISAAVLIAVRHRIPWRAGLPFVAFLALGLLALRNLAPFSLVVAASLGVAQDHPGSSKSSDVAPERQVDGRWTRPDRLAIALFLSVAVFVAVDAARSPSLDLRSYPRDVVDRGEASGVLAVGRRVATQDVVGCYLILRRGRRANVFIDDRYDMYPVSVPKDYVTLLRARPGALAVLDRYRVDTVLWERAQPLVALLRAAGWDERLGDDRWVVFTRPGTWLATPP